MWRRLHQINCFLPLKTDKFCDEQADLTLRLLQQETDGLGFQVFFSTVNLTHSNRSTAHREVVEAEVHCECNIGESQSSM